MTVQRAHTIAFFDDREEEAAGAPHGAGSAHVVIEDDDGGSCRLEPKPLEEPKPLDEPKPPAIEETISPAFAPALITKRLAFLPRATACMRVAATFSAAGAKNTQAE